MKKLLPMMILLVMAGWINKANAQAFTFTAGNLEYNESFDGMGAIGTNYLTGWTAVRYAGTGTPGAVLTMAVTDGSSNSGNAFNVGATGAADRALGSIASGSTVPRYGASFLNSTNATITKIELTGVMEQWRSSSSATVNEKVIFEYSLDATEISSGTWVAVTAFDLVEKLTSLTDNAAKDGNLADNKTALSAVIDGITWTPNATLWIRWSDANDSGSDGLYAIDDLKMTVTTGSTSTDPEPSNHVTDFKVTPEGLGVAASWTDATGTQIPAGYLLKISTSSNIAAPADGTYTSDDLALGDGSGAKNVAKGIKAYTFSGLEPSTVYYLKIFPYTNAGTLVDYKTDGTVPSASATTHNKISYQNFEASSTSLTPWTEYSVAGDQVWSLDSTHGINNSKCAKMSGYSGAAIENEDWLLSPALDFTGKADVKLQFQSAYNYAGTPLLVLVSWDYTSGNPSANGTWSDVSSAATFSAGNWVWTPSGVVNLDVAGKNNVHVAFKYTSNATEARTWELDEILITAGNSVGIANRPAVVKESFVSPNPASGYFNVRVAPGKYMVKLYNNLGAEVRVVKIDNTTRIETAGLHSGLYSVVIENQHNNSKEVHKLIIK